MSYKESQRFIHEAELALSDGKHDTARAAFRQAAVLQRRLSENMPPERSRTRSVYGVSAATLYYRAGDLAESERLAAHFLSQDWLETHSREQARVLLASIREELLPLSAAEVRANSDLATNASPTTKDTFGVRVISAITRSAVRLRNAPGLYRSLYNLFFSSASAQEFPVPYNKYGGTHLGREFAAGLSVIPATERSYSFAVESNLSDMTLVGCFGGNEERLVAFNRNVMARVVRGLHRCKIASENGDNWENLDEEYRTGMNANMCDAVVRLYQEVAAADTEIEFSVLWSPNCAVPEDIRGISTITYNEKSVRSAGSLGSVLKLRAERKLPKIDVVGHVIALKDRMTDSQLSMLPADEDPEPDAFDKDRVVTMRVEHEMISTGVGLRVLHMSLSDEEYAEAWEAFHPKTKRLVRAKGQLVRLGRKWILDPCDYFGKIDPPG